MKRSKKLSIISGILGGAVVATTVPAALALSGCSLTPVDDTKYTIQGAGAAVECYAQKSQTLSLKDDKGNVITSGISWSFDKTHGDHSDLQLNNNTVTTTGTSYGNDTYNLKAFYNGKQASATFPVSVADAYYISGDESSSVDVDSSIDVTFKVMTTREQEATGFSWSINSTQQSIAEVKQTNNKFTFKGKKYGSFTFTITATLGTRRLTFSFDLTVNHKYTVMIGSGEAAVPAGQDAPVLVLVGQTTSWLPFYLRDEEGNDVQEADVAWSIYGTGTHAHVQRNSAVYNEFNVTGESFGEDILSARAIFNNKFYEFKIYVYIYHYYHIDGLSTVNVTVGKSSNNIKLRLLDETGTEVSDPQNVTWYLNPDDKTQTEAEKKYSKITLTGDTYFITGKEYVPAYDLEEHMIYAEYDNKSTGEKEVYKAPVRVNVDHTYHVSDECQEVNVRVGEDNAPVEGDEWIRMELLDENNAKAVPKQRLDWSIYGTGTHATFSRDPNSTNGYKVHGKTYGTDKVNARAIFDGTYYEFVITVNVGHAYSIDAKGFSLLKNTASDTQTLTLYDENNNAVPNGTTGPAWTLTNTEELEAQRCTTMQWVDQTQGTFTITPKTDALGIDEYKVTAKYDNQDFEKTFKVEVSDYHIVGTDPMIIPVNGTASSDLVLYDSEGPVDPLTTEVHWSIKTEDVEKEHSEANIVDDSKVSVVGKSYGQDRYDIQATFTDSQGATQTVTAPLYVTVGHIYSISGETSISVGADTVSKNTYQLLDETKTPLSDGASWSITPGENNAYSTGVIDPNTGVCTITAGSSTSLTTDTYKIEADYKGEKYNIDLSVEVSTFQIENNDNYYAPLGTLFPSPKATLKLTKGLTETITEGVTWSAVSKTTTPSQTKCCEVTFENPNSGEYTVKPLQLGTEVFVITALYDGVEYTTELSITVFDPGNVYYEIQTDDTTKTCTLYKYLGTTGEGYDTNKLIVPEQIGIYKVTKIGPGSFSGAKDFSSIDFSQAKYLETIGQASFSGCKLNAAKFNMNKNGLEEKSLDFSKTSLVSVEKDAFLHAIGNENTNAANASFKYLKFPTTIRSIGTTAFGEKTGVGPVVTWWVIELESYKEYSEPWFNQIMFTNSNETEILELSLGELWTYHRNNYYSLGLKIMVPSAVVSNYKNITNILLKP